MKTLTLVCKSFADIFRAARRSAVSFDAGKNGNSAASSAALFVLIVLAPFALGAAQAATIWNGPKITFTKANNANPSLATSQDRITANVWLTRDSTMGLYNAA